jgi:MFS family permease
MIQIVPPLAAIFAGAATFFTLGFVPAVAVGAATFVCGYVGMVAGGFGGGIVGGLGSAALGSVFGAAAKGRSGAGVGAGAGLIAGGGLGAILGATIGAFGGSYAGYDFTHDAMERFMGETPAATQQYEAPTAVDAVEENASLKVPAIAAPALRAA